MANKEIKYFQLEPAAFLTDPDFINMNAEERGVYWSLLLVLYCNGGRVPYDPNNYKGIAFNVCNCFKTGNEWLIISENVIKKKFQIKNGFLRHKRVDREIKKSQSRKEQALTAINKRWSQNNAGNTGVYTDELLSKTKTKVNIREENITKTKDVLDSSPAPVLDLDLTTRATEYELELHSILRARTPSERTTYNRLKNFITAEIEAGRMRAGIFGVVLGWAREAASLGDGRIARPTFIKKCKEELGFEGRGDAGRILNQGVRKKELLTQLKKGM